MPYTSTCASKQKTDNTHILDGSAVAAAAAAVDASVNADVVSRVRVNSALQFRNAKFGINSDFYCSSRIVGRVSPIAQVSVSGTDLDAPKN